MLDDPVLLGRRGASPPPVRTARSKQYVYLSSPTLDAVSTIAHYLTHGVIRPINPGV